MKLLLIAALLLIGSAEATTLHQKKCANMVIKERDALKEDILHSRDEVMAMKGT